MGIFDFLKRNKKDKSKAKNYGYQRVVDDTKKPSLSTGIPQAPRKTKPAEMPKPPRGKGGIATPKGVVPGAKHVPSGRTRYNHDDDYDYGYPGYGYGASYVDNAVSPLGDADFDGTPNIVDNTPYGGSETYCTPDTSSTDYSSSSWTSDTSSSGCYDSGSSSSSSSYDSGSSSSYDSGSSSSYDSGSSSYDSGSSY